MTNEEARAIMILLKQSYINLRTNSDLKKKTVKENIKAYDMAIKALEQETGHWINITKQNLNDYRTGNRLCFECDQCHHQFTYSSNFCPNCGARMVEPQESEIQSDNK